MGRRGHVQVRQPVYGSVGFTDWAQGAAASWLRERGVSLCTQEECGVEYADRWEIEIPRKAADSGGSREFPNDYDAIQREIDYLREHKDALDGYLDEDMRGSELGEDLADLLDEGLKSAKKRGYTCIAVEWF